VKFVKRLRITIIIAVITVLAITMTGCTTFDNFKAAFIDKSRDTRAVIKIGVLEPVTGVDSPAASEEIRGIQLANKVYPNVNGKIVELVFSDNKSNVNATETAVETLISKEPKMILGSYGSVYSLVAASKIEEAKIPSISITNTNPLVTKNYDYYLRVCYVDANQGDLLAQYVLNDGDEVKTGVMRPEKDDAAIAMATTFANRIRSEKGDDALAAYETYVAGTKDFSKQLNAIKKSGATSILLIGENVDTVDIINQAARRGIKVRFLGDKEWGSVEFAEALSPQVSPDNLAFVQFFSPEGRATTSTVSKQRRAFLDAYEDAYGKGKTPSDNFALGYDAYCVALDALDKAPDDAKGPQILEVLQSPDYSFKGATGLIHFSIFGDPVKTAFITTWENMSMRTIYTVEPTKQKPEEEEEEQ
jgi:branched-chain amino acid transport system substrate-binding protein